MTESFEREAQALYKEHKEAADHKEAVASTPESPSMSYDERKEVAISFLEQIRDKVDQGDAHFGFDVWEYGHPVDQVIGMIDEHGPEVKEAEAAAELARTQAELRYQANSRMSEQHFADHAPEYKQSAVADAHATGIDVDYPPITGSSGEVNLISLGSEKKADTPLGSAVVEAYQTSTRPTELEFTNETFSKDTVDFSAVEDHLAIHHGGEVAGSQFNSELFSSASEIIAFVKSILSENTHYDTNGMAELTFDVELENGQPIGFTGVKSLEELRAMGVTTIARGVRTPGGQPAVLDGVAGAWYPEMARNPETGAFEVVLGPDGAPKNLHGKFEPEANIATVPDSSALETTKLSVVIKKDQGTGRPVVLTMYPGDNAPMYPAKIQSEAYQADTLMGSAADFWDQYAFIQVSPLHPEPALRTD